MAVCVPLFVHIWVRSWACLRTRMRFVVFLMSGLSVLSLMSGCNQVGDGPLAQSPRERPKVNLSHADVAFISLEGPPEPLASQLLERIKASASAHQIGQAEEFRAHYLLRGYVTAFSDRDGIGLTTVWDVFSAGKQRIKRLDNNFVARGARGDVWSVLDGAALAHVSEQMVGDLEDYLEKEAQSPAAPFAAEVPQTTTASALVMR
jgi:hypothetical protein